MMNQVIRVQQLSKRYGDFNAVQDLSFSVNQGDVYGFLGQNGAGKSTTIRMLLDLIRPTCGSIELFGLSLKTHRREILQNVGAVIERPDLYTFLTGMENLRLFAGMSGSRISEQKIKQVLSLVGLAERGNDRVSKYSLGMKQRLGIAVALVHEPELLILDEPTNGLDPQGIADIRRLIQTLSTQEGKTILVSSHLLSEVEQIANRMLILDKGKAIAEGSVQELLDPKDVRVLLHTTNDEQAMKVLNNSSFHHVLKEKNEKGLFLYMDTVRIPQLNRFLVEAGVEVLSLESRSQLEHTFLKLTHAE
jgi:ABC-type multidrug transport system ATPase subunit